jgi:long-subunit fatty acid transport protein
MSARRLITVPILLLALLALVALDASASLIYVPNTYGLTTRGIGLVNALASDDKDLSLAYYNPAGLARIDGHRVGFGYTYTVPQMSGGRDGGPDVEMTDNNRVVIIGVVTDVRSFFSESLPIPPIGFGFNVGIDDNFSTMMVFDDMRTPDGDFYRYGLANLTLQAAFGIGITDWLSAGLGFHGGFRGWGEVETRADVSGETGNEGTVMRGAMMPRPLGGLFANGEIWRIGLTYRDETYGSFEPIDVDTIPSLSGQDLPEMDMSLNFFDTFVPAELVLGTGVNVTEAVRLMADFSWRRWGRYDDAASEVQYVGSNSEYDTVDIYTPRGAVEANVTDSFILRGGYRYEQTPFRKIGTRFPEGGEKIVGKVVLDNDSHITALGGGYTFNNRKVLAIDLILDFAYQLHYLVPRKVDSSDGFTYESSGTLHLFSTSATLAF